MKKIISFILVVSMVFSMGLSVFAEEEFPEPNVAIQANGGEFRIYEGNPDNVWTTSGTGFILTSGTLESNNIYVYEDSIKYWTEREFLGWLVYSGVDSADPNEAVTWTLTSETPISTDEMHKFDFTDYDYIMFEAKWEGNDRDYFVDVMFEAVPGTVYLEGAAEYVEAFGQRVKKGLPLSEERVNIADPVREGVTEETKFEGWILIDEEEDKITSDENGYILYTSAQINAMAAPDKNMRVAAKWADIPFEAYLNHGNGGEEGPTGGSEEDANVIFDCYGGRFIIDFGNNETMDSDMFFANVAPGDRISDSGAAILPGFPERETGFTFEGWLEFNMDTCEFVSSTPITGNIFEREAPDYKVSYIAKWAEIDFSQYVYGESHNFGKDNRNIGFYANGGRNIDIWIDGSGENHGGSSNITQITVEDGKSLNEAVAADGFVTVDFIPVKDGIQSKSWTLVKADSVTWKEHILGTDFVRGENDIIVYNEILGAYQRYLVAENAEVLPQTFHSKEIFRIADDKSYFAIANWKHQTKIEIDGTKLNIVEDLELKVPEGLENRFKDTEEIKEELANSVVPHIGSFSSELGVVYLEIYLTRTTDSGEELPAEVPEGGLELTLSYPYGTGSKGFDFVVAHLLDSGDVEIFSEENENLTLTDEGIVIKVNSLSPFAIYFAENGEAPDEEDNSNNNNNNNNNPGNVNGGYESGDKVVIDLSKNNGEDEENPNTGAPVFF